MKRFYDGQLLEREDYERKTYLEFEREDGEHMQVPEDDIEFRAICEVCEEVIKPSEMARLGVQTAVCEEHLTEELKEAKKGDEN